MTSATRRRFLLGLTSLWIALRSGDPRSKVQGPRTAAARIVVVGGGYGGATAARYLKLADPGLDVTLIHRDHTYLSCPGANEVIAGIRPARSLVRDHNSLVRRYGIRLLRAEVAAVDAERKRIRLTDRSVVPFDRAILAPGIGFRWEEWDGYDVEASRWAVHAWQSGAQVERLRAQIRAMRAGGVVVVLAPPNPYRCPPGPYERASLMAHYLKRHDPRAKILIIDSKTQFSKQALFQRGWSDLYPGMIDWLSASAEGSVERIDARRRIVHTEFGEHRADVLNVIPPQKAGTLAATSGLTDKSGWCPVDPRTFASTLAPDVHVIGDACNAAPMPKSAFAANSQAKICAGAVAALVAGRPPGLPSLINHCYSFLAPDYAISVTGVYEYSAREGGLAATATGETPMDGDRRLEARQARAWQRNFRLDVFG